MRKQHFAVMPVLLAAGALLVSCQHDKELDVRLQDSKSISLRMNVGSTRSAAASPLISTNRYPLPGEVDGLSLCLEETVLDLDALAGTEMAATRGTPLFTENASQFFDSFKGTILGTSGDVIDEDGTYSLMMDGSGTEKWRNMLGFDPFSMSDPLTLFLRLPATQPGVSGLTYTNTASSHVLEFEFRTPATASEQQDILFATRTLGESEYKSEFSSQGGAAVLFRHALTGVKFAIANNAGVNGIQTFITGVTITGLKSKGHAVFVPDETAEENVDNTNVYSSKSSFTWSDPQGSEDPDHTDESGDDDTVGPTDPGRSAKFTQSFTQEQIRDYVSGDAVGGPASFYQQGQNQNLNDETASLTFWFIPQEITDDVKMTVTVRLLRDGTEWGTEKALELKIGKEILKQVAAGRNTNKEWKAGQLRTFTLKPDALDVEITDTVEGFEKSDVKIRNTGNIDAYVRAAIVANWYGDKEDGTTGIALGYSKEDGSAFINSWKMVTGTTDNYGGEFTGLPGTNWVKGTDGYFYCTTRVAPGAYTAYPLFNRYVLDTDAHPVPKIYYMHSSIKPFRNVRLVMDIPVQAVEAPAGKSYIEAWADAGVTVTAE